MGGHFNDEFGSITVDDRFLPLIVTTWTGTPGESTIRDYFRCMGVLLEPRLATGEKSLEVSDATDAGMPNSTARKLISELHDAQAERFGALVLRPEYVVTSSPVLRGAMTAINWIARNAIHVEAMRDLPSALEVALARLDREGLERPVGLDPDAYQIPVFDESA